MTENLTEIVNRIDVNKVLSVDRDSLHEAFREMDQAAKIANFHFWFRRFVYASYTFPAPVPCDFLFCRSLVRNDYRKLFNDIFDCAGQAKVKIADFLREQPTINHSFVRFVANHLSLTDEITAECPVTRSILQLKFLHYLFIFDHLRQFQFRILVLFADMQPLDHLLAEIYSNTPVITVTLQHGLYVDYKSFETINRVNYLNHNSDYFLSWGDNTKKLIEKYHPDARVVICGKPQIGLSRGNTAASSSPYVLIIGDQMLFTDQNIEMIEIVSQFFKDKPFDIFVKFHPWDRKEKYFSRFPWLKESSDIGNASLVVGHTSSVIYEALAIGKHVLKYHTEAPSIPLPASLEFSNLQEFEQAMGVSIDSIALSKEYIEYLEEDSLNRYREFFSRVLEEDKQSLLLASKM